MLRLSGTSTSFNSTLVQLKVSKTSLNGSQGQCFNSTLVQLKVNGSKMNLIRTICFNSTLVQLKAAKLTRKHPLR